MLRFLIWSEFRFSVLPRRKIPGCTSAVESWGVAQLFLPIGGAWWERPVGNKACRRVNLSAVSGSAAEHFRWMCTHIDSGLLAVELSFCTIWHAVALNRRSRENMSVVQAFEKRAKALEAVASSVSPHLQCSDSCFLLTNSLSRKKQPLGKHWILFPFCFPLLVSYACHAAQRMSLQ